MATKNPGSGPGFFAFLVLALDGREHILDVQDDVLVLAVLDLGASELGVQHPVADLYIEGDALVTRHASRTHGDNFAFLGLFLGRIRDDQTRRSGLLGFDCWMTMRSSSGLIETDTVDLFLRLGVSTLTS